MLSCEFSLPCSPAALPPSRVVRWLVDRIATLNSSGVTILILNYQHNQLRFYPLTQIVLLLLVRLLSLHSSCCCCRCFYTPCVCSRHGYDVSVFFCFCFILAIQTAITAETARLRVNLFPETKGNLYVCPSDVADVPLQGLSMRRLLLLLLLLLWLLLLSCPTYLVSSPEC